VMALRRRQRLKESRAKRVRKDERS
jgi:hypothetical protein